MYLCRQECICPPYPPALQKQDEKKKRGGGRSVSDTKRRCLSKAGDIIKQQTTACLLLAYRRVDDEIEHLTGFLLAVQKWRRKPGKNPQEATF